MIPPEDRETVRRRILACLEEGPRTARELSSAVGRREKEIGEHLEHIRKSLRAAGRRLVQIPATCRECGFAFRKRDRLRSPGHCPICRGESIEDPVFRVEGK